MITGRQIRAARGLLGWDASALAEKAGLSRETISNIETSAVQARESTLNHIAKVFIEHRLEFIDNQGVRFRPEGVEVLNGREGVARFWDLVFFTAQTTGGIFRQNGINDEALIRCAPDIVDAHIERMAALRQTRRDSLVRVILLGGDYNFVCTEYADYKWHPKNMPAPVPYYVFGDTVCIFVFETDPSPKIILISSPIVAAAYIKQFDETWEMAKRPPQTGTTVG
ncbi:MAG: helix-turn-helix transcriptional regulator [Alphaproteobacteria bacterium]|nr:helix-turn-helix transcriptional regulator [Alphaproteobacteria bacterium]